MHTATFRFYEELNDFLPKEKRKKKFDYNFINRASVKDVIESFGVPHTEVDLIIVNGESKDFSYIINDVDDINKVKKQTNRSRVTSQVRIHVILSVARLWHLQ